MVSRFSWTTKAGCPDVLLLRKLPTHPTPTVTCAPASSTGLSNSACMSVSPQETQGFTWTSVLAPNPDRPGVILRRIPTPAEHKFTRILSSSLSSCSYSLCGSGSDSRSSSSSSCSYSLCGSGSDSRSSSRSPFHPSPSVTRLTRPPKSRDRILTLSCSSSSPDSSPSTKEMSTPCSTFFFPPSAKVVNLSSSSNSSTYGSPPPCPSSLCTRPPAVSSPPAKIPKLSAHSSSSSSSGSDSDSSSGSSSCLPTHSSHLSRFTNKTRKRSSSFLSGCSPASSLPPAKVSKLKV